MYYNYLLRLFLVLFLIVGCSKDDSMPNEGNGNDNNPVDITLTKSLVQKGPFVQGSTISLQELNDDLTLSGNVYNTETIDDFGSFDVNAVLQNDKVDIAATGFYFNEVTGQLTNAPLTLRTFVEFSNEEKVNLNILTTISRQRIKHLMSTENLSFKAAKEQAEKETLNAFNIPESLYSGLTGFEDMDISQNGDSNGILLAISAITQGDNSVAELGEFIAKLSEDLKEDGVLTSGLLKNEIIENSKSLDFERIKQNLAQRFTELEVPFSIPEFRDFVDSDGDGIINLTDVVLNSPVFSTNNSKPEFKWSGSNIAGTKYHIQVSDDETFTNLLIDQSDLSETSFISTVTLENDKTYWWRVNYIQEDSTTSDWNSESFLLDIGFVNLVSPEFNSNVRTSPHFKWENNNVSVGDPVETTNTYDIQVSNNENFDIIIFEESNLTEMNIQTTALIQELPQNPVFYWRVRIVDENGVAGTWNTSSFLFYIEEPLIHGQNTSSNLYGYQIIYDEQNNPDFVGYDLEVQIASDIDFNTIVKTVTNIKAELNTTYPIWDASADGFGNYHYRVRHVTPEGIGSAWWESSFGIYEVSIVLTETNATSLKPIVKWSHEGGTNGVIPTNYNYKIVVASDNNFINIIEENTLPIVEDTATQFPSYRVNTVLNHNQTYYYKISIISPNGNSLASETSSFIPEVPRVFTTSFRPNENEYEFEYAYNYERELKYEIELSEDLTFNSIVNQQSGTITNNGVATDQFGNVLNQFFIVPNNFNFDSTKTYYYRVRLIEYEVTGDWFENITPIEILP